MSKGILRTLYNKNFLMPEYLLSVTYRDLVKRKKRWAREKKEGRRIPLIRPWLISSENNENCGIIVKIDNTGKEIARNYSDFIHGVMVYNNSVLCASHHTIQVFSRDLIKLKDEYSYFPFNALHSMRVSSEGFYVCSAGTDSIFELDKNGKVIWSWYAGDHGYINDSFGTKRVLDKNLDHRLIEYDTWLHTTHVNAACELNNDTILATSFMRGAVIMIDKKTGSTNIMISDLKRPHAIRVYPDKTITFVDTANGKVFYGKIENNTFVKLNELKVSILTH
jgi:hypothetical protein